MTMMNNFMFVSAVAPKSAFRRNSIEMATKMTLFVVRLRHRRHFRQFVFFFVAGVCCFCYFFNLHGTFFACRSSRVFCLIHFWLIFFSLSLSQAFSAMRELHFSRPFFRRQQQSNEKKVRNILSNNEAIIMSRLEEMKSKKKKCVAVLILVRFFCRF